METQLLRCGSGVRVAFFDVFETLIERMVDPPEAIKLPVCRALAELVPTRVDVDALLESRQRVERALSNRSCDEGAVPAPRLDELLSAWTGDCLGAPVDRDQRAQLAAIELDTERQFNRPVPGMTALVGRLAEAGWRVYFLAETSLDANSIRKLLDGCGYRDCFADGQVSSTVALSRRDGRLFRRCLEQWGYGVHDVAYVCATRETAMRPASALGLHTFCLKRPDKDRRIAHARSERQCGAKDHVIAGAWLTNQITRHVAQTRVRHRDTLYQTGLCVLGPLLTNFVHRLIEQSIEDATDLLVFAAREGFVLGEIYERLTGCFSDLKAPPWVYAYVSRKSTYGAGFLRFDDWAMHLGTRTPRPTIGKLLTRFSLAETVLPGVLQESGFSGLDDTIDSRDERVGRLFGHPLFEPRWRAAVADQAALLGDYLMGLGVGEARRPALVDPGWYGSMQVSINGALQSQPGCPLLHGYYLLLWSSQVNPPAHAGRMTGVLHDGRSSRRSVPIGRFAELIEAACRAPHGTTESYDRQDGRVVPRLRDAAHPARQAELRDNHYVTALQAGIFDYADGYCELKGLRSRPPAADTPYAMSLLDRLIRYPTAAEARDLSALNHSEDVGLGLVAKHEAGRRLAAESDRVLWLEGELRKTGGLPLIILYNLYRSIKCKVY
ncbi:MAG: hypothetical protein C1943_03285 [Halochromatium sp.]|nr:hypothetical protein [Halochromatium sp.]